MEPCRDPGRGVRFRFDGHVGLDSKTAPVTASASLQSSRGIEAITVHVARALGTPRESRNAGGIRVRAKVQLETSGIELAQ